MSTNAGRLDRQRPSRRLHKRKNTRLYRRGYTTTPHAVWGDSFAPVGPSGAITMTSITPATFAAVAGSKTFVIRGTGFVAPLSVNFCGSLFTGGAVVVDSTTQVTLTVANPETNAALAGTNQPVWVVMNAGASNKLSVAVTATAVGLDQHVTDPGSFTIPDIETWVDANPDLADEVLAAEQARPTPRVTLVDWLQGFISHRDEGTIP